MTNLGVAVFSSLGCGHFDNLAWAALENNMAVLPKSAALHGVGLRGPCIGPLKGFLMVNVCHCDKLLEKKQYNSTSDRKSLQI